MDSENSDPASPEDAFAFVGSWREFAPIAFTNLLLTIATLGIYRFWARARERRYLWSRTRFIDERLEWAGTGKEMFVGFLVAMAVLVPGFLFATTAFESLILRGETVLAFLVIASLYIGIFYLTGVALFRALRYRLSRTYWRGIRGGSNAPGWHYGFSAVWRTVCGILPMGVLVPWAMVSLWNERWGSMSFGQYPFRAEATAQGLTKRWMLLCMGGTMILLAIGLFALFGTVKGAKPSPGSAATIAVLVLFFYAFILVASLAYYALYYRHVIGSLSLSGLDFTFSASSRAWFGLILGNIGLVIVTLGIGAIFLPYRNWSFFIRHLGATGEIDLAALSQSTTRSASDAEGLASAFDIGAI
ncbi:YjgN family protein [Sphingomonas flavalba]|uniref:YjgN family protein n=1 Tax=Sphingomonas flavalba TaxID=2559804 RepID=UPI0039E0E420